MSPRSFLYRCASLLGDVDALRRGPSALFARLLRKELYKGFSRFLNRLFR